MTAPKIATFAARCDTVVSRTTGFLWSIDVSGDVADSSCDDADTSAAFGTSLRVVFVEQSVGSRPTMYLDSAFRVNAFERVLPLCISADSVHRSESEPPYWSRERCSASPS